MQHDGDARVERHAWGNSGENYLHSSSPAIDRNDARVPVYRRLNAVAYNHSDSDSGDETDEELVILSTNALSKTLPTSARKSSASMAGTGQPREGSLDGTWHAAEFIGVERQPEPTFADDVKRSRFPFAIVWTPIPCLTWFFPFIGHMGICDSRGVSYDFAGPYSIGIDELAFGLPCRYITLDPDQVGVHEAGMTNTQTFDACVDVGCGVYSKRMHNLICDNCHSHVARCLNEMRYLNRSDWNMVYLAAWMFFRGKYVSPGRGLSMWIPFLVMVAIILAIRYGLR